jgi:hypothetical protein
MNAIFFTKRNLNRFAIFFTKRDLNDKFTFIRGDKEKKEVSGFQKFQEYKENSRRH